MMSRLKRLDATVPAPYQGEHFASTPAAAVAQLAPWSLPAPARLPALGFAGDLQRRRVLVARTGRGNADGVGLAASLLEASGAVRCIEVEGSVLASGDPRALARLITEGDALLVDSLGGEPTRSGEAGRRAALPRPLQVSVRLVSAFGSAVTRLRPLRPDLPIVAPIDATADAWQRAAEFAFALAGAERRDEVWCASREPGWPLLAADRARRLRRAALSQGGGIARRVSLADARRRLLFPDGPGLDVLLADAGELDGLVRAAAAGVGWSNAVPSLHLGAGVALAEVATSPGARRMAANGQLAFAAARLAARLLHGLGQHRAARRLDAAVAAELVALSRGPLDPWIELASEPAIRLTSALLERLAAPVELAS